MIKSKIFNDSIYVALGAYAYIEGSVPSIS